MARIVPKDRALFEQHASPDAIAVYLQKARTKAEADRRAHEQYIAWLVGLLGRRMDEEEAGTWPPKTQESA